MQDERQLEAYRRMTPAERLEIWFVRSQLGMALWEANLDEKEIERRRSLWRREHDLSDANKWRAFRNAR